MSLSVVGNALWTFRSTVLGNVSEHRRPIVLSVELLEHLPCWVVCVSMGFSNKSCLFLFDGYDIGVVISSDREDSFRRDRKSL